jgi:hypothetical protein
MNIPGLTAELGISPDDALVFYDEDAGEHKAILVSSFVGAVVPGEASSVLMFGNDNISPSTTTRYLSPGAQKRIATTTQVGRMIVPRSGTIRSLFVRHNSPAGNGNTIVYTIMVNGVATALMVTLASTAMAGSDIVNNALVVAGDEVEVRATKALNIGSGALEVIATMELAS